MSAKYAFNPFEMARAQFDKTADLLELAGAVPVSAPPAEPGTGWDEVRRQLRDNQGRRKP